MASVEIAAIAALTVLAAGVGTLSGFGTSTIMVPVLVMFFPLPVPLLLVGIVHWFGDVWKIALFRHGIRWPLLVAFGIPGVVFSFVGARLSIAAPEELLSRILGGFLLAYVGFILMRSSFRLAANTPVAATGGALSGFLAGIFGVGGAVRGAFLSAFDLEKTVYIATSGAIAIVIDTVRIGTYVSEGTTLPVTLWWGLLVFIPASFAGAKLAERVVKRIPQDKFRRVIALFLLLASLKLLAFP